MRVHEDLTQQQNNAVHFVFKILPDDGQVVWVLVLGFFLLFFGFCFKQG